MNWYKIIRKYYLAGVYSVEEIKEFVELKKITETQAEDIINEKEK